MCVCVCVCVSLFVFVRTIAVTGDIVYVCVCVSADLKHDLPANLISSLATPHARTRMFKHAQESYCHLGSYVTYPHPPEGAV